MLTKRSVAVVLAAAWLLFLTSCHGFFGAREDNNGGGGTGVVPSFAVVANTVPTMGVPNVTSYQVNANTGALTLTTGSLTTLLGDALGVAADAAGTHIFLATGDLQQGILNFPLDRNTGVLQTPSGTGVLTDFIPSALVSNSAGTFVYSISSQNKSLAVFQVANNGSMSQSGTKINFNVSPLSVALDPSGRFLYVVDDTFGTYFYTINTSSGDVSGTNNQVPANGGLAARGIAFTPDGKFAYISNGGSTGGVDMYAVNANNGSLMLITNSPAATGGSGPGAIAVDPTGKYLYVANSGSANVAAFTIAANGTLTPIAGSPFAASLNPVALVVDPSGSFVYVAAKDAAKVLIYKIGSSGGLTKTGSVDSSNPVSIVVTK